MKKKAIISIFATVFFVLILTLFSYAAIKTQDGLQVELTTDKSSYTSSDTISVTVKVTNTGTTAVSDLTLENTIPSGYTKTTNTSSTKSVSILLAGDEATLTTSFVKDGSGTSSGDASTGNVTGDSGNASSDSSNASGGSSGTGGNSNSSSSGSNSTNSGSSTRSGNSSSDERSTTNATDDVTATSGSDSSQAGNAYGAEDLTRGEGTTSATSGDDTTSGEISGTGGDSSASDVNDDGASDDSTSLNEGESTTSELATISENENAYETVAGVEGSDIDRSSTGDGGVSPVAIAVGVIVVVGIAVAIVKIKSGKKLLSILICVSVVNSFDGEMMLTVMAAEYKTIELSESIKIGTETVKVVGSVKYQVSGEEALGEPLPMPESLSSSEQYFWDYYDVYQVTDVTTSDKMYSEKEVLELLGDRGFEQCTVEYYFTVEGEWVDFLEASNDSVEQHPMYVVEYISNSLEFWAIYIVNDQIWASPLTYNLNEREDAHAVYISETGTIQEHVSKNNQFYTLIPKPEYCKIKVVDRIDAATLNSLTRKELDKNESSQ